MAIWNWMLSKAKGPPSGRDTAPVSKAQNEPSGRDAVVSLPPGVKLLRTLRGHENWVGRIAWSPDGRLLASPSADQTIRLWDPETGECLRTLTGHSNAVMAVAFDPIGRTLASASDDHTVRLWDGTSGEFLRSLEGHVAGVTSIAFDSSGFSLASGSRDHVVKLWDANSDQVIHTLEGHDKGIRGVAFDPTGCMLASASEDGTIKLWNAASGEILRSLEEHSLQVLGVAFDPAGGRLASVSLDNTVKLWDAASGQLHQSLESHTDLGVKNLAFSCDGQLLASKGGMPDDTIRLWRSDTGACVATIPEPSSGLWPPGLAFHPRRLLLATVGSDPDTPQEEMGSPTTLRDRLIHIWELDFDVLLAQTAAPAVSYTSAKIVLVGDSGVGKTGLGWRLAHGEFKEQASTHGQQFWVLDRLNASRRDGARCEAVLWDLAGQPDYRLIHALFLDDADLGLVLFDPTDSRDPLHGVEFWLKQLKVGQPSRWSESGNSRDACRIILVAARADRGTATLTREELDAYCHQRGIPPYISTSAKEGEGMEELIARMQALIPWDEKPPTITTSTFKRVKDHVLALKENREEKQVIVSPQALRQRLEATDADWRFSDAELTSAVGHLENHGYVKRLRTSKGETRILLAPELLNNLAASFVLEARRNEKGLGSLEEKRLFPGEYPFRELEGLSPGERDVLLDSAALLFLEHHICFRETDPLSSQSYLVFPDLINLKKPAVDEEQPTDEGVAYTVNGPVENVYASLVVLLGYTHTFTRTDQWRNQARYEVGRKLLCGFRLDAERDGELDFVLYFGVNVGRPVRTLFQSLFESFLARRNLTVFRYEPVACSKGHPLNRAVVREQLNGGADFAFCPKCGERLKLPKTDEPIQLTREQQSDVDVQRRVADLRTRFEQCIFSVQTYVEEQGIQAPECFISYAWGDPHHERWVERNLATDLQKAGMDVVLDRWENAKIGASVSRFVERIEKCDRILVVGTPLYRTKYENKDTSTGYVVAAEVDVISNRLLGTEAQKETVLPLLLAGEKTSSLPPLLHGRVHADFRDEQAYFTIAFDLMLSLYQIPVTDPAVADLRDSLRGTEMN